MLDIENTVYILSNTEYVPHCGTSHKLDCVDQTHSLVVDNLTRYKMPLLRGASRHEGMARLRVQEHETG